MIAQPLPYRNLPDEMKDAIATVRHLTERYGGWSMMVISIEYPGSTGVAVVVDPDHEHCVIAEDVCSIDAANDDHARICCTCRLPL